MMSSRASRAPTARLPAAFSVQQCNRDISRLFHQQHYPHKQQHHKCRENAEADGRDPQLALHKLLVQNLIMSSAIEYVNIHGVLRRESAFVVLFGNKGSFENRRYPASLAVGVFWGGGELACRLIKIYALPSSAILKTHSAMQTWNTSIER